ncbi:MAG: hypothetical protein AAB545_01485 [Patescibacteria group bacterium]
MEILRWHIFEYEHEPKTPDWYWAVSIIVFALSGASFYLGNVLLGIILLVGIFTLLLLRAKRPEIVICEIHHDKIICGNTAYPFEHLHSFHVETRIDSPRILLASKKVFSPLLTVPIHEDDATEIREALRELLPEKEHRESVFLILFRRLGF